MTINEVLRHFRGVRRGTCSEGIRESYMACCPCHNDKQQSLGISLSDSGKILLKCFSGCDTEGILQAAGLSYADIGSEKQQLTCFDRLLYGFSQKYGEGVKVTAEYRYKDENGKYLYSKLRIEGGSIEGKLIRYYKVDKMQDKCEKLPDNQKHVLYRLPEFIRLKNDAAQVFIVEGEKDVETLRKLGNGFACATTAGGVSDWHSDYAEYFKGLRVVILSDNDEPGKTMAARIRKDLKRYAHSVKVVTPSELDKGDVTDYLEKERGTAKSLWKLVSEAEETFAPWVNPKDEKINSGLLTEAVRRNERFIIIRNPADNKDLVYRYRSGVYRLANSADLASMVREYIPPAKAKTSTINDVMAQLLMTQENVYAATDLNTDSRYINFRNGLYDIETKQLIPHDPYVISTFQFDFDYAPDNKHRSTFKKYMNDLCKKPDGHIDYDQMKVIQEYMGFVLSNVPMMKIKKALVLLSSLGDSGKSVFLRLITAFLGLDKIAAIKLTELTSQNRFILGTLPYSRAIVCDDESNTTIEDNSIFKAITGGGVFKAEAKSKQAFSSYFNGGFMFACNGLPYFAGEKGEHLFNRLLIIPCEHHIEEDQKDANMDEKLQRELPSIMNWALEGLHRLKDNGYVFTESEAVNNAREEYRKVSDNVYRFLSENYIITRDYNDRILRSSFDNAYLSWALASDGIKALKKSNIPERLASFGVVCNKGNAEGARNVNVYRGIKEKPQEFIPAEGNLVPFEVKSGICGSEAE